jgi:hypothetical protein
LTGSIHVVVLFTDTAQSELDRNARSRDPDGGTVHAEIEDGLFGYEIVIAAVRESVNIQRCSGRVNVHSGE